MSKTRKEIASLGGKAVFKKYGSAYMSEIGKRGYQPMIRHYMLQPVDLNDFAIISRETGKIVAYLSGKPVEV